MAGRSRVLLITTGDTDGIGVEVAAKALQKKFRSLSCHAFVYLHPSSVARFKKFCTIKFSVAHQEDEVHALTKSGPKRLVLFTTTAPAPTWVANAAKIALLQPKEFALVTGPISKPLVQKHFPGMLGHTDIFKSLTKNNDLYMSFLGKHFNVLLASGHIPLEQVPQYLTLERLISALSAAAALRKALGSKKPIGLLGLNPHAGDSGLIGTFENDILSALFDFARKNKIPLTGPLVPDAAFSKKTRDSVSLYLALYHDQGLIPFKLMHGQDSGAHLTQGLAFIRTSVDHGTAKDIFSKGIANENSMVDALLWAKRFLGVKK